MVKLFGRRNRVEPRPPVRRVTRRPHREAVLVERLHRVEEGLPQAPEGEIEEAVERWLDPEPVPRSLVTYALEYFERHWWLDETTTRCRCGWENGGVFPTHVAMRRHKEDVLAAALGLSIKLDPK